MDMKVYRYSIGMGDCGGVVFAENFEDAIQKVGYKYYGNDFDDYIDNISAWEFTEDEYFDAAHTDVIECYGI